MQEKWKGKGFIIRGCKSENVPNTTVTGRIYEKYKLLSRYLCQQKLTKLTVPCNNCKWWFG